MQFVEEKTTTHSFINSLVPQYKFWTKMAEWKEKRINKKQAVHFFLQAECLVINTRLHLCTS